MNESQQIMLRSWKLAFISYAATVVLVGLILIDMHLAAYQPDLLAGIVLFGSCLGFPTLVHRHLDASLNFWDGAKTLVIDWLIMFVAIWIAMSMAWGFGAVGFVVFIIIVPMAAVLCQFFATKEAKNPESDHVRGVRVFDGTKKAEATKQRRRGILSFIWPSAPHARAKCGEEQKPADLPQEKQKLRWSGEDLPATVASANFVVVGAIGTGKTLMHRELMHSVLSGTRMLLIFDLKPDVVSQLYAWGLRPDEMVLLNPFDAGAWAWDIAADFSNPLSTDDYAEAFVPTDPDEPQKYFTKAMQDILSGVLQVLIRRCPGIWTLRDIINITSDEPLLRRVLNSTPRTTLIVKKHLGRPERVSDVLSTLGTFIDPLTNVATIWDHTATDRKRSLIDWCMNGREVLVMGSRDENKKTLDGINRVMFNFIASRLTSGEEKVSANRTWIFCDELRATQRLDGLNRILNTGRSKGIRVVVGFQTIGGLTSHYGKGLTQDILGNCLNQTILNTGDTETARWASERIGTEERKTRDPEPIAPSENKSQQDIRRGERIEARIGALTSQIFGLPLSQNGNVEGYHLIPLHPDPSKWVRRSMTHYPFHDDENGDNFHERKDIASLEFQTWTEDDAKRLGLADVDDDNGSYGPPNAADQPPDEGPDLDSFGRVDF